MNSDSGNISDPNNDLIQTPKLPDFKIQTNDTHLLYSTSSLLFKNYSQVNVKITDSIGNQWSALDNIGNGNGGSAFEGFQGSENGLNDIINFPINIEVEASGNFVSKVFNYEMTSDSGNIADPNNVIYPTQVFIPANSSIALDGSILDVSAISTNEMIYINPSSLSDFIY